MQKYFVGKMNKRAFFVTKIQQQLQKGEVEFLTIVVEILLTIKVR